MVIQNTSVNDIILCIEETMAHPGPYAPSYHTRRRIPVAGKIIPRLRTGCQNKPPPPKEHTKEHFVSPSITQRSIVQEKAASLTS